jgi:hypothetical protein
MLCGFFSVMAGLHPAVVPGGIQLARTGRTGLNPGHDRSVFLSASPSNV